MDIVDILPFKTDDMWHETGFQDDAANNCSSNAVVGINFFGYTIRTKEASRISKKYLPKEWSKSTPKS